LRRGVIRTSKRGQGESEIVVELRQRSPVRNGPADEIDRGFVLAALMSHNTEQVERIGVCGISGKDLPVKPFGLGKPPRPVLADR
jgi:hypothetical protein